MARILSYPDFILVRILHAWGSSLCGNKTDLMYWGVRNWKLVFVLSVGVGVITPIRGHV